MTEATSITPLFERLIDEDVEIPFEKTPKRFSSQAEIQESIMKDLSNLLNTRVSTFWKDYGDKSGAILPFAYGVNVTDCSISAESVFELQELQKRIDNVIALFEPRILNAKSNITSISEDRTSLCITIDASIMVENQRRFLSFPIVVEV
ncbi:MAG: type VI secretion system baseplate subunit TssE [Holosporaceae bacterium]|jgi:type VI secretion system lysozyme-like protein|nr:type VI secretion system baseplate subunit TssE [Holosporaceae bacterium]